MGVIDESGCFVATPSVSSFKGEEKKVAGFITFI